MDLSSQAIKAALCADWQKAVDINNQILKNDCQNVDCLNRLGKAYLELGEYKKAAAAFRKVLKIDKYNPIAQKNLARALSAPTIKKKASNKPSKTATTRPNTSNRPLQNPALDFLEEPGKTKLVSLVNLGSTRILLKQKQADQVFLILKRRTVMVEDAEGNYLGSLPDDLSHRLYMLIKHGNKYCALIKSASKNCLVIFIREIFRAKKLADTPSFAANIEDYFSYIRDDLTASPTLEDENDNEEDTDGENLNLAEHLHADEEISDANR